MQISKLTVPDIGDFDQVEVIEIMVNIGDKIAVDDSLITIESDKASMEIPASQAGTVTKVLVKLGDKVSEGSEIFEIEAATEIDAQDKQPTDKKAEPAAKAPEPNNESVKPSASAATYSGDIDLQADVVVLGSGPGGYTAAFRAADLGKSVILIEKFAQIGGVCLNVGCIPSKALLHVAEVLTETKHFNEVGIEFQEPKINLEKLREHKNKTISKLNGGLAHIAKQRKVTIVTGYGRFTSPNTICVTADNGSEQVIGFENSIIAAGSSVSKFPFIPWEDKRVWDSTDALEVSWVPKRLLIAGAGIIGLEMATIYHALGSQVTLIGPKLLPGVDRDLIRPFEKELRKRYENIFMQTRLKSVTPTEQGLVCQFNSETAPAEDTFDAVLVAIGRTPNGHKIDAEKAGVFVDEKGFVTVDSQQRTNVNHIFAIGDIVGQPMLAHKATHEAKIAAEVIAGFNRHFDVRTIPSVAYTNPEVAWCGKTEEELKEQGIEYEKGVFPWAASGRALSVGAELGMTKVLYDKNTHQMIGAGILGKNAGELIAEAALAIEMGAELDDIALTIHPHPTLSETLNFATEVAEGTCTDIYAPKK